MESKKEAFSIKRKAPSINSKYQGDKS